MKKQFKWVKYIALILVTVIVISCIYIKNSNNEPIFTVLCIADLHNQQSILKNGSIRGTVLDTCKTVKQQEKQVDAILIGGDVTSNTKVKESRLRQVIDNVADATNMLTKNVLWVSGNHDFNAGEDDGYESAQYYDFYMRDNVGILSKHDSYYEQYNSTKNLLAYRYKIRGFNFIGINTSHKAVEGELEHTNYTYSSGAIDWVDKKLEILKDESIVFVVGHYPLRDSVGLADPNKTIDKACDKKLKDVLLKYKNVIYLYGHDHATDSAYIKYATSERVTTYLKDGTVTNLNNATNTSFTSAFMGSMRYFSNSIDVTVGTSNSKVVQALMIYVYRDRIELQMKNYGIANGGAQILKKHTIYRKI